MQVLSDETMMCIEGGNIFGKIWGGIKHTASWFWTLLTDPIALIWP